MGAMKLTIVYNCDLLCSVGSLIYLTNIACPFLPFVHCAWGDRLDKLSYDKPASGSDSLTACQSYVGDGVLGS
jgi:hypothetical protein